jgi:radical SAM superfamily enzyme YgiQ (UPF0313 family)
MKVGFIAIGPNYLSEDSRFPHIGIGYMMSVLEKEGHECFYIDTNYDDINSLYKFQPDIMGISVMSSSFSSVIKTSKEIKNKIGTKIVLGGPHINIAYGEALKEQVIDYAIYGEGEITICELLKAIYGNSTEKLSNIPGLIFRKGEKVVVNPPRPWINDLDSLPYPAHHHFEKYPYGRYPLLTNRGCPHQCVYCSVNKTWGRKVRSMTAESIVAEIEYLLDNWGRKPFIILDDTFNISISRAKKYCRIIIDKNLKIEWGCWSFRADRVDEELAELMKKSGCGYVSVGIESAEPEVLKRIKKGETIEDISKGIECLKDAGIRVHGNFMIGNPGDNLETIKKSINYANKIKLNDFDFYLALPYPGTELWNYVEKEGKFLNKDYTKFHHFSNASVFETEGFSSKARGKAYLLAKRAKLLNSIRTKIRKKYTINDIIRFGKRVGKRFYKKYIGLSKITRKNDIWREVK